VGDVREGGKSVRCIKGTVNSAGDKDHSSIDFDVYPNPAGNTFFVRQHGSRGATLLVLDLLGNTILRKPFTGETTVTLGQAGIYLIRVSDGQRASVRTMVIR
jgi:hypothetical protein